MSRRDRILLPEIDFQARVGLLPGESERPQALRARLELRMDLEAAAASDEISESFDYRRVPEILEAAVASGPCDLLESLAGRILAAIMEDSRIRAAGVLLTKQSNPLGDAIGPIGVELWREREDAP